MWEQVQGISISLSEGAGVRALVVQAGRVRVLAKLLGRKQASSGRAPLYGPTARWRTCRPPYGD